MGEGVGYNGLSVKKYGNVWESAAGDESNAASLDPVRVRRVEGTVS
jgi:hypothetical protein